MKDFTKGPILKALVSLSVPIVLTNMLHTAYQLVDTFWVGRLGKEAVAAVSLSFPIIFLLITLGAGFTIAGTILVAQYKGRKDHAQVEHVTAQTVVLMLIVSVICAILGLLISQPIMELMGAEADVLAMAVSYLKISFLGMPFMFGFFMFQSVMRGIGEVYMPMKIVFGTVMLNLVLDPLFIMGYGPIPAYGVSGAAVATIFTQGLATLAGMIILLRGKHGIKLTFKNFKFDFTLVKQMFSLGLPSSIEQSMKALGLTVMSFLVASFGTAIVAAYGIGIRILSFVIIPAFGLSMATSTLVGQNMGAEKPRRAEKIANRSVGIGFITIIGISIIIFFAADFLAGAFLEGEPEVLAESALFIRYLCFGFAFMATQLVLNGVYSGAGITRTSMIFSIVSTWLFEFPIAYIMSKHSGLSARGLWIAYPISSFLSALVSFIYFRMGRWKNVRIIPSKQEKLEHAVQEEAMIEEGL
ncbi:MAG: MATE family efflux transporter [Candidatus Gracilibacteria bacterium]